jgi:hypothetical protein
MEGKDFKCLSVNLGYRSQDPASDLGSGDEVGIKLIPGCGGLDYGNRLGDATDCSA